MGNILLSDDGVGVRVVEQMQRRYRFPPEVEVIDGGTLGLDLLAYVENARRLVVVDALELGAEPGALARLEGAQVPAFFAAKVSVHQMGLVDLLAVAKLTGHTPEELVLWGVQPATLEAGLELSPAVAAQLDALVEKVLAELTRWGIRGVPNLFGSVESRTCPQGRSVEPPTSWGLLGG